MVSWLSSFKQWGIVNCTFILALAEQQEYEGQKISIDGAPRTVLALSSLQTGSLLASKPQIKLQVHGEGSVSTGHWCLKRYYFSHHHQLLWSSYLPCLVFYISLPSCTGTLTLTSWHTLTMKRPKDQMVNIQSMKK